MAIDLAKELAKQLSRHGAPIGVVTATLTKYTPGTRTVGEESSGTQPTSATYTCRGYVDETEQVNVEDSTARTTTATIGILGASLSVTPAVGDKITIRDVTYRLTSVKGDGVSAVWECEGTK